MSSYISYIGPYIKLPIIKNKEFDNFIEEIDSEDYCEVGYSYKGFKYLVSSGKNAFSIDGDDFENIVEKEITVDEINNVTNKFIKKTKEFVKIFNEKFSVELSVKYGAIFYES